MGSLERIIINSYSSIMAALLLNIWLLLILMIELNHYSIGRWLGEHHHQIIFTHPFICPSVHPSIHSTNSFRLNWSSCFISRLREKLENMEILLGVMISFRIVLQMKCSSVVESYGKVNSASYFIFVVSFSFFSYMRCPYYDDDDGSLSCYSAGIFCYELKLVLH